MDKKIEILKNKLKKRLKERKIFYFLSLPLLCIIILATLIIAGIHDYYIYNTENINLIEINILNITFKNQYVFLFEIFSKLTILFGIYIIIKALKLCCNTMTMEEEYRQIVKEIIESSYDNVNFQVKEFINPQILKEKNLVKDFNRKYGDSLLIFSKNDKLYSSCNLDLKLHVSTGKNSYTYEIFKGQVYTLKSNINIPCRIRIVSSTKNILNKDYNSYFPLKKKETLIDLENQYFNNKFQVYTTNEEYAKHYAFYTLVPKLMEKLLNFKEYINEFELCIENDNIIFLIKSNKKMFYFPKTLEEIEDLTITKIMKEINSNFSFIENIESIFS